MSALKTFRVEFEDMPEFLKPMLRDEAAIVLDTKGLEYTEGDAHAVLRMSYVHNLIPPELPARRTRRILGTPVAGWRNAFRGRSENRIARRGQR